ncbi:MAG: N-acetylneuraminate lyase [Hyphomicrobiales bacterium]
MTNLTGFFAALPTPFTSDGTALAHTPLGDLVERNLADGLTGLYVGGSTGEAFLMTVVEREHLLRQSAEASAGKGVMVAQVGDPNPAVSARLAKVAAKAGYHAISAVPPFYYQYTIAEIEAHYRWLAIQTDLPFLIYNFPALSGVRWSVNDLAKLLDIPQVVGVKNTCADLYAFEQLRRRQPGAALLHGFDETLLSGLATGADGGIGSTYNLQATRILALAQSLWTGDLEQARTLQSQSNALIDALVSVGVLPALKYMLERSGIPMGACRPPFQPLTSQQCATLDAAMDLVPHSSLSHTRGQSAVLA